MYSSARRVPCCNPLTTAGFFLMFTNRLLTENFRGEDGRGAPNLCFDSIANEKFRFTRNSTPSSKISKSGVGELPCFVRQTQTEHLIKNIFPR